jgi:hypothetical protein
MSEMKGHCLCGAVRWTSQGPVTRNLVCHCQSCQRATSAPFAAFIGLDPANVAWSGALSAFESSPGTFRDFCPACGTRMTFRSDRWPGEVHILAATLDDPGSYIPEARVVMRERPGWLDGLGRIPAHEGFQKTPDT